MHFTAYARIKKKKKGIRKTKTKRKSSNSEWKEEKERKNIQRMQCICISVYVHFMNEINNNNRNEKQAALRPGKRKSKHNIASRQFPSCSRKKGVYSGFIHTSYVHERVKKGHVPYQGTKQVSKQVLTTHNRYKQIRD